jgi:hypothetical protein
LFSALVGRPAKQPPEPGEVFPIDGLEAEI